MTNTIFKTVKSIEAVQQKSIEIPWKVWTSFAGINSQSKVEFFGTSTAFSEKSDFKSIEEQREAIDWLVQQFGGTVKWTK